MAASSPISFARGAPAPELIPSAELADCACAAARSATGPSVFAYGPGGGYGPLRAWVAERHGVEPQRVVLTMGGLLGFVLYAAEALVRRPGSSPRGGPDIRPATADPRSRRRRGGIAARWTTRDSIRRRSRASSRGTPEPPSFLYTVPHLPEPERAHALRRAATDGIAESPKLTASPVLEDDPYGLVRYEGEAEPHSARARWIPSSSRTPRRSRRRSRRDFEPAISCFPTGEAAAFEQRAVSTYISPPFLDAGDDRRVHRPRPLRAQPRARVRRVAGAPRCDARGART